VVALPSSNTSAATVGANVTVAANASTATFPVNTQAVAGVTPVTITATYNGSASGNLTVNPPPSFNPIRVNAGGTALVYSTMLGGQEREESVNAAALDAALTLYAAGSTVSGSFPTTSSAFKQTKPSTDSEDAFFAKITGDPLTVRIACDGIVNAASFQRGPLTPGELVTIFGTGIGPSRLEGLQLDATGRVSNSLAATRVLFDGVPSPLVYVSATQSSVIVPYAVFGKGQTVIEVEYLGSKSNTVAYPVAEAMPGLFSAAASGRGQGAILNQDYSVNSASNPAGRGEVALIYATGEGQTDPPGEDGKLVGDVLTKPKAPVSVLIGGLPAELLYAGGAPGLVAGVLQVNVRVPEGVTPGSAVPVVVIIGQASSQSEITLAVR